MNEATSGTGLIWEWVPSGAGAHDRLAEVVAELKGDDPMARVSVVVPANPAGVAARRALGARRHGDTGRAGVVGVWFGTLQELAAELSTPTLMSSGSRRMTDQELLALVRMELGRTDGGVLAPVRHHPSTQRAVADAIVSLRQADDQRIDERWPRALAREVKVLGTRIATRAGLHDEADELMIAGSVAKAGEAASIGPVVLVQPEWLRPHERNFVRGLADGGSTVVVLATATGVPAADVVAVELAQALGVSESAPPSGTAVGGSDSLMLPGEVAHVVDPDTEVREAVAWLVDRHGQGVPWSQMALAFTSDVPYARLAHRTLDAAAVPWNGPSSLSLADTAAGRLVTLLGRLHHDSLARADVIALLPLLSSAAAEWPIAAWDLISRRAGVVAGIDEWSKRLGTWASDQRAAADVADSEAPDGWRARRLRRADRADSLRTLVADRLVPLVEPLDDPGFWSSVAELLSSWLDELAPGVLTNEVERGAVASLRAAFDRFGELDAIEPSPSAPTVSEALEAEVARRVGRHGTLGEGLLVGSLAVVMGAAPAAVAVVGVSEGAAPRTVRPGSILGVAECQGREGDLGLQPSAHQLRRLLGVVVAPGVEVLLTSALNDPRTGRPVTPSRWMEPPEHADAPTPRRVSSLWAAAAHRSPLTRAELTHRQLQLTSTATSRRTWAEIDGLAHAAAIIEARLEGLSEWSGLVGAHPMLTLADREVSVTSLERYATCPSRYLYHDVLRLRAEEEPEDVEELDVRSRGTIVHLILERWGAARIALDGALHDELLDEIATDVFVEWAAEQPVGRAELWEREQKAIRMRLQSVVELEMKLHDGWTPVAVEMAFGGTNGLVIDTPEASLRFRGRIDRVDRHDDGSVRVIDYKVPGGSPKVKRPSIEDVRRGTKLQLPLYALAAVSSLEPTAAAAAYWYIPGGRAAYSLGVDLAVVDTAFREALADIVDGIGAGVFPTDPGEPDSWKQQTFKNCKHCEFDRVCSTDREAMSALALADQAAAPIRRRLDAASALSVEVAT